MPRRAPTATTIPRRPVAASRSTSTSPLPRASPKPASTAAGSERDEPRWHRAGRPEPGVDRQERQGQGERQPRERPSRQPQVVEIPEAGARQRRRPRSRAPDGSESATPGHAADDRHHAGGSRRDQPPRQRLAGLLPGVQRRIDEIVQGADGRLQAEHRQGEPGGRRRIGAGEGRDGAGGRRVEQRREGMDQPDQAADAERGRMRTAVTRAIPGALRRRRARRSSRRGTRSAGRGCRRRARAGRARAPTG